MEFWLIFLVVNISISCLIFFTKIYINIKYKRSGEDDYIAVNIYLIKKLVTYSMQVPIIEVTSNKDLLGIVSTIKTAQNEDKLKNVDKERLLKRIKPIKNPRRLMLSIKNVIYYTRFYSQTIDKILRSLVCERLYWKTIYGSEDAAITGIMTGSLWTIKALLLRKLENRILYIAQPVIAVNPMFGCNRFEIDFQCIFSIRIGNLIKAFRVVYDIKK